MIVNVHQKILFALRFDIPIRHFDIESTLCNLYSQYDVKHERHNYPQPPSIHNFVFFDENL